MMRKQQVNKCEYLRAVESAFHTLFSVREIVYLFSSIWRLRIFFISSVAHFAAPGVDVKPWVVGLEELVPPLHVGDCLAGPKHNLR